MTAKIIPFPRRRRRVFVVWRRDGKRSNWDGRWPGR